LKWKQIKDKLNVFRIGATSHLGSFITKHYLKKNLPVDILVLDPEKNKELVAQVEEYKWESNSRRPITLKDCTQGVQTVISVFNAYGNEKVEIMVDWQTALVEDCMRNQVKRLVPSDFGVNIDSFAQEEL